MDGWENLQALSPLMSSGATLLLITTFLLAVSRHLAGAVRLVAIQSAALAGLTALAAASTGEGHLYVAALLVLVVKAVIIPAFLFHLVRRIGPGAHVELALNTTWSLLLAGVLTVVAYRAAAPLGGTGPLAKGLLPVALALLMVGLLLMIARRLALMQVVGLLVMENGLFLTALAMASGLPLVVELGISFDVLLAAIIMGILVHQISDTFDSIDVDRMKSLRG